MPIYRMEAVRKAASQNGVKEQPAGSNHGPMVDKYQQADSLGGEGYSWCASFVNWCFREVGRPLKELNLSASVGMMLAEARKLGWDDTTPNVGDIVCFDWDSLTGPGKMDWPDHVGIVASVGAGGTFKSWEGNTAVGNDSNGGQVMLRDRNISMVEGFIRVPGGYKMEDVWRVRRDGETVRDYGKRYRAVIRIGRITKNLKIGQACSILRIRKRIELPNA